MKKNLVDRNVLHFSTSTNPKSQLIKALHFLDSSRQYERLLENPKTEGPRELFLPENDFKTYYTVHFLKKHPDLGGLETNCVYEIQTLISFSHALTYMNSI